MLATFAEYDLYTLADVGVIAVSERVRWELSPLQKEAAPILEPRGLFEGEGVPGRWETYTAQDGFHFGSVHYDAEAGHFRYWYHPAARLTGAFERGPAIPPVTARALAYATSRDGQSWERPALHRLQDPLGDAPNLLPLTEPPVLTVLNPSIVPLGPAFAPHRWAACYYSICADPLYSNGVVLSLSEDGLAWQPHFPPALPLDGDRCTMMWDAHRNQLLITTRSSQHRTLGRRWGRAYKRHIGLARSRDLRHWTPLQTVLEADDEDPIDVELYSMNILPYGHGYIGFLEVFHTATALLDVQLTFSRDLERWQRVGDRGLFLARGEPGAWDGAHICLTMNPPHPEGDRLRFWYGGKAAPHWQCGYAALGTATLRRDGFVAASASASGAPGVLTTIPFRTRGRAWLYLNADASHGEIAVEAIDAAGVPVPGANLEACQPVRENGTRILVTFDGGRNEIRHAGPFRLRFHLRNATLYAFKLQHAEPLWPEPV